MQYGAMEDYTRYVRSGGDLFIRIWVRVKYLIALLWKLFYHALACPKLGVVQSPSGPTKVHGGRTSSNLVKEELCTAW